MALPRNLRFQSRREIASVLRRGRRINTSLGRMVVARARASGRILFVVSTKVAKKSVRRHTIKRQLDAWAHARFKEPADRLAYDLVVFLHPTAVTASRAALWQMTDAAVARLSSPKP